MHVPCVWTVETNLSRSDVRGRGRIALVRMVSHPSNRTAWRRRMPRRTHARASPFRPLPPARFLQRRNPRHEISQISSMSRDPMDGRCQPGALATYPRGRSLSPQPRRGAPERSSANHGSIPPKIGNKSERNWWKLDLPAKMGSRDRSPGRKRAKTNGAGSVSGRGTRHVAHVERACRQGWEERAWMSLRYMFLRPTDANLQLQRQGTHVDGTQDRG